MEKLKRFVISLCVMLSGVTLFYTITCYASPINTYSGWSTTSGPIYLGNTDSIYFNSYNDIGGVKSSMRSSYTYTSRRTRVLGYRLMQSMLYPQGYDGSWIHAHRFTDVQHPDGRLGYTEWFDSPFGVYLDYQQSRLPAEDAARNTTIENTIVSDTLNYNKSINTTSSFATIASSDNGGELSDAKGASILLRRGIIGGGIYLSSSDTVDNSVKDYLKQKGVKTVYISGGVGRFKSDALFNDGFNVIRVGGNDRQHTLDLSTNMPSQAKSPSRKFGNVDGGLIIEGISTNDPRYSVVKSRLESLKSSGNMSYLKDAFNYLIGYSNVGDLDGVRSWSSPAITIGVNYSGFETYCSIYGSRTGGTYIYNVVAPGYFSDPGLWNDAVRIHDYEYHVDGSKDYWVKLNDQYRIMAKSSLSTSSMGWAYPRNEVFLTRGTDYKIGVDESNNLYYINNPLSQVKDVFLSATSKYQGSGRNYTENWVAMKSTVDNADYKIGMYTLLAQGTSIWWGGYGSNEDYLKTDGSPPKSDWEPASRLENINSLYIMQQHIYDNRSGLVVNSPYAYVYMDGSSNKGNKIPLTKDAQYYDYSKTVNLPSHLGNNYGNMRIEIWARDNVGNEGIVKSYVINRPNPTPTAESATILNHEYEDSTTKWVQANNEFYIDQRGYNAHKNPDTSLISIVDSGNGPDDRIVFRSSMLIDSIWNWGSNYTEITRTVDNRLSWWPYGGNQYAQGNHYLKINSNFNGRKFDVWGLNEIWNGSSYVASNWVKDPKKLGVDAVGPRISYTKTGRDEITVNVTDAESGVKNTVVTRADGTTQSSTSGSFVVNLNDSTSTKILSTDNVGNTSTITIGNIQTTIISNITTAETTINGRKMMKVTATATVTNPVPGKVITFRLTGTGDGLSYTDATNKVIASSTGSLNTVYNVDDTFNQSYGPSANYASDSVTYSRITYTRISDIIKSYSFNITSKYDYESSWTTEASKSATFSSGEKDYRYTVTRISDSNFNSISPTVIVLNGTTTNPALDVSSLPTGDYIYKVKMYDYNNNPSGETSYQFRHVQPLSTIPLGLGITAVKDIAWAKATYPINYLTDSSKFPVGKNYKFNSNPIKLGYAINYSLDNPQWHITGISSIDYTITDESGVALTGKTNGKTFADSDRLDSTGYLKQSNTISMSDGKFRFKHFLPADATFTYSNGSAYNGTVVVNVKFTLEEGGISTTRTLPLYAVTTTSTALDDLYLDKQR